jgi:hypothetical protein
MIDEIIDRAVPSYQNDLIIFLQAIEKRLVICLRGIDQLCAFRYVRFNSVIGKRIKEIVFHWIVPLPLPNYDLNGFCPALAVIIRFGACLHIDCALPDFLLQGELAGLAVDSDLCLLAVGDLFYCASLGKIERAENFSAFFLALTST